MIVIGSIKVPPIDEISENECQSLINEIINFAKSNPQGPERETFDFKRQLNLPQMNQSIGERRKLEHELRKDFSSFANTRGGLILVGIDEKNDFEIVGIPAPPKDEQLAQILAEERYIRPPLKYRSRAITYQNKTILLYYIPESYCKPVEVKEKRDGRWVTYCRRGNITNEMTTVEKVLKFYRGIRKLPPDICIDVTRLGYYTLPNETKEPFVEWTVKKFRAIYEWLETMWLPLILIPSPSIPFYTSEVYTARTGWHGTRDKLLDILVNIENMIQKSYGIAYEAWTTLKSSGTYISGCGAKNLKECIRNYDINKFGWFLTAESICYLVMGEIYGRNCELDVEGIITFIPNNFPFVSIDEIGRIMLEPLSVRKRSVNDSFIKEWKWHPRINGNLWLEDVSDKELASLPAAQIIGYFGEKPKPRSYNSPLRAKGLTLLRIINQDKFVNPPPLISNADLLFSHIVTAPIGLDDLKEIKIIEMELNVLLLPQDLFHDLTIALFAINSCVNQSKSKRLEKA